jgi:hypothetical protein
MSPRWGSIPRQTDWRTDWLSVVTWLCLWTSLLMGPKVCIVKVEFVATYFIAQEVSGRPCTACSLWWTQWQWSSFPPSVYIFPSDCHSMLIYRQGRVQQAILVRSTRDSVSPHSQRSRCDMGKDGESSCGLPGGVVEFVTSHIRKYARKRSWWLRYVVFLSTCW